MTTPDTSQPSDNKAPDTKTGTGGRSFFAAVATVSGFTMMSRVLGFIRDIMVAQFAGTGPLADAFFIAFRLPNLFRRWFAEGAFNVAFVPLFSRRLSNDGADEAQQFANQAMAALTLVLFGFTLLAELFMPQVMAVIAPGFNDDPMKAERAVLYARIMFPYLSFMALLALYGGVLNALKKFAAPAAAPVALNVVLIIALLANQPVGCEATAILSWAVAFSGLVQWVIVLIALERQGFYLRPTMPRLTADVRLLFKRMVPGMISGGVMQIDVLIASAIASMGAGAISYLYYAERIIHLPIGVIGVALGVVLLPTLSERLANNDQASAMATQNRAAEAALLLTVPACLALVLIPDVIIGGLFERGAFSAASTASTAPVLAAYALAMPALVLQKVFQPGYYAAEDTVTPVIFATINMAINAGLGLTLFPIYGAVGLGIAMSVSSWMHLLMLMGGLMRRGAWRADKRLISRLVRIILAALMMGGALYGLQLLLADQVTAGGLERIGALIALVGAGLGAYGVGVLITRAAHPSELKAMIRRS